MRKLIFIILILLFATIVYAYDSELDNLHLTGWFNVTENATFHSYLGVGITTPVALIHMVGDGTADTGWARFGLSTTEYTEIGHRGSNGAINTVGDGNLDFRHDGTTLMNLTDTGNLAIVGNLTISQDNKFCYNAACTVYSYFNGTCLWHVGLTSVDIIC